MIQTPHGDGQWKVLASCHAARYPSLWSANGRFLENGHVMAMISNALIPIFAGLLLGYLAGIWRAMDNQNVQTLNTFVTSFAIPCSIFLAVANTPIRELREQVAAALVLAIVYTALYAIGFFWSRSQEHLSAADSSVLALTVGFPNSAAVGLPLLASVFGPRSAVTVATSVAIGCITISPMTLMILEASRGSRGDLAWSNIISPLLHSLRQPIVLAPMLGLLVSCIGWHLPSFASQSLAIIGAAADGAALVLTGLVVSAQMFEVGGSTLVVVLLKNAVQPALTLLIARLIRLPIEQIRYATLISAMPCGFFGPVFGKRFGSNPQVASSGLIASYISSVATLPAWIAILNHLA
jgi:malonate transporter